MRRGRSPAHSHLSGSVPRDISPVAHSTSPSRRVLRSGSRSLHGLAVSDGSPHRGDESNVPPHQGSIDVGRAASASRGIASRSSRQASASANAPTTRSRAASLQARSVVNESNSHVDSDGRDKDTDPVSPPSGSGHEQPKPTKAALPFGSLPQPSSISKYPVCVALGCGFKERFEGGRASQDIVDHYYSLLSQRKIDVSEFMRCMRVDGKERKRCTTCGVWCGSQHFYNKHAMSPQCLPKSSKGLVPPPDMSPVIPSPVSSSSSSESSETESTQIVDHGVDSQQDTESIDRIFNDGGLGSMVQGGLGSDQIGKQMASILAMGGNPNGRGRALLSSSSNGAKGQRPGVGSPTSSISGSGGFGGSGGADARSNHTGDEGSGYGGLRADESAGNGILDRGKEFDDDESGGRDDASNGYAPPVDVSGSEGVDDDALDGRVLNPDSSTICAMRKIMSRVNVRWLDSVPNNLETRRLLIELCRKMLQAIEDATNPDAWYRAWLEFFQLPDAIFAIGRRGGGRTYGKAKLTKQIDKRVRDYALRFLQPNGNDQSDRDSDHENEDPDGGQHFAVSHDDVASAIRGAERKLSEGYLSRAFGMLRKKPFAAVTEEVFQSLEAKFPRANLSALPAVNAVPLVTDVKAIKEVLKVLAKGGAAGPSHWAPDLFLFFRDDDGLCDQYGRVLVSLINKREWMTQELAQLVLGARLVVISKPPAAPMAPFGVRPICVSEAVLQQLQMVALMQVPKEFIDTVFRIGDKLIQYGVGAPMVLSAHFGYAKRPYCVLLMVM